MIFTWVYRVVIVFAILTAVYIGLSITKRWAERRRRANEYRTPPVTAACHRL